MAPRQRTDGELREPTRAIDRALRLLVRVAEAPEGVSLTDAARDARLAPSTALRQLRSLEAAGFVVRDAEGRYAAGATLTRLGLLAAGRSTLAAHARPHLASLADQAGESAYLAVRSGARHGVYLAEAPGPSAVRHVGHPGELVPLHGSALGAALDGAVDEDGAALRVDAVQEGVTAVAAPVRGADGSIVGAIGVLGPGFRLRGARAHAARALVRDHADRLGRTLGADPPARSVA